MTKSQLQPGMIAVTRDGNEYLVLPDRLLGITQTTGIRLRMYAEDLTMAKMDEYTIIQVYNTKAAWFESISNLQLRTLIWQREEYQYPIYCQYIPLTSIDQTLIVEFTDLQEGTIVHSDQAGFIGTCVSDWKPHTDKSYWKPVEPPKSTSAITLEDICKMLGVTIKEVR